MALRRILWDIGTAEKCRTKGAIFFDANAMKTSKSILPSRHNRCVGVTMLLALLGAGLSVSAATLIWTNVANANWNVPSTWVEDVVPTASDDVIMYDASILYITNAAYARSVTMENLGGLQWLT